MSSSTMLKEIDVQSSEGVVADAIDDEGGRSYRVTGLQFEYVHSLGQLPAKDELKSIEVELGYIGDRFVAPREGVESIVQTLGEIGRTDAVRLSESALESIVEVVTRYLQTRFRNAKFFVAVDDRDVHPKTGADLRRRPRDLRFRIEFTGPTHLIDNFRLIYRDVDVVGQPSIDELMEVEVSLVKTPEDGYVAWRPGVQPVKLTLSEIAARETERYTGAAVQQVLLAVRDWLLDRQYMAVYVQPDREQLGERENQPGEVTIIVTMGVASEMRTVARGERIRDDPDRPEHLVNHPYHQRIREGSPVQPGIEGMQLLRRDAIDEHIYLMGRHPGRRVDVGIGPGEDIGTASLDYIVTENKPWLVYAQASNTGTPQTGRWRQRFGLFHSQLTNNDDILNFSYDTASFSDLHTVSGSYEAPFFGSDRVRWRVDGLWSEFDASEVGFADLRFLGETWSVGGELIANVYQDGPLFIDVFGGLRYFDASTENLFFGFTIQDGQESFLLPRAGVRLERFTEIARTHASVLFELHDESISSVDQGELTRLGRLNPDKNWLTMRWDALHAFYLEPLLFGDDWRDVESPETSTLAHEIMLGFRGQYAFGNRLVPQLSMVAGGLHSVRGYPESIVAGDTVLLGTAEYRFHLPRAFAPKPEPNELFGQPFRWAPQQVFGQADWNLLLRGFVDVGRTIKHDSLAFEEDQTLIGAGVGMEFLFRRNLNIRLDWGFALKDIDDRVSSGSNRLHFSGTLLF